MIEPEEIFLDSMNALGFDHARHEGRIEKSLHEGSVARFGGLLFLIMGILAVRLLYLQVIQGDALHAKAVSQSFFVSTMNPPRGQIIDRYGALLAGNESSFDVVLHRSEFLKSGTELAALFEELSRTLGVLAKDGVFEDMQKIAQQLPQEIALLRHIDQKTLLAIQASKERLPGVSIEERYSRTYPNGVPFATLLGYVGIPSNEADSASGSDRVGKLGIERQYDAMLRGTIGKTIAQIDAERNSKTIKTVEAPEMGVTLRLAIDADLQKWAYEALSSHIRQYGKRAGAVVILDPNSGAIRALVSYPSFDNNLFGKKLSQSDFKDIFLNSDTPLFNRAVSAEYPPGSTIKPIIASAALEENIIDPMKQIFSAGSIQVPNPFKPGEFARFLDWKALGWMDMRNALAFSSNVYFYSIGGGYGLQQGLGIDRIKKYEQLFGLGRRLGVDFPGEGDGFVPDAISKAERRKDDPLWRIGDTYNTSIGQGDTLVTPLQVAAYTAFFANGKTLFKPYLVQSVLDPEAKKMPEETSPQSIRSDFISQESVSIVRSGMRLAVTAGTARRLASIPVAVAGKTGTAETGRLNEAHAWFTGFAPFEHPEIVITVFVEKGGEGSSISVPIAEQILQKYFSGATSTPADAG